MCDVETSEHNNASRLRPSAKFTVAEFRLPVHRSSADFVEGCLGRVLDELGVGRRVDGFDTDHLTVLDGDS